MRAVRRVEMGRIAPSALSRQKVEVVGVPAQLVLATVGVVALAVAALIKTARAAVLVPVAAAHPMKVQAVLARRPPAMAQQGVAERARLERVFLEVERAAPVVLAMPQVFLDRRSLMAVVAAAGHLMASVLAARVGQVAAVLVEQETQTAQQERPTPVAAEAVRVALMEALLLAEPVALASFGFHTIRFWPVSAPQLDQTPLRASASLRLDLRARQLARIQPLALARPLRAP